MTQIIDSKIYLLKNIAFKFLSFRKLSIVIRKKEWYDKNALAIWWKRYYGTGIIGKPNHQFKYFMIGLSIVNIRIWLDFKWIGKSKKDIPLKLKD